MKFSIKYFLSKCDQIRSFLPIWSHKLKKPLLENFIFCTVPRTPGMMFRVQIVHNYQSLIMATKTHTPGVTGHIDPLLNLIVIKKYNLVSNMHVANSLEISFTEFARAVFRNPIFDL